MSNSPTFEEVEKLAEEFFDFPTEQEPRVVTRISAILFAQYVAQAAYRKHNDGSHSSSKYHKLDGTAMTFGIAIEALKKGKRVARAGWNGKGMWLGLVLGYDYTHPDKGKAIVHTLGCQKLPWIGMKTADNKFVPWLASQTDVLAEDWQIVE